MSNNIAYTHREPSDIQHRAVVPAAQRSNMTYKKRETVYALHKLPGRIARFRKGTSAPIPTTSKRKLALLLPGHNEELIIAATIESAIAAGQAIEDIYVVDDNSSDKTRKQALSMLPKSQVLTVKRSGKALAVQKAIKRFKLVQRYEWVHVADADSIFSKGYFDAYRSKLDDKRYVVAIGFVQSMRGNWISTYRAVSYTYNQHVNRRIQARLGMISVFPGSITAFRTDILKDLDMAAKTITEDFDVTLQVHRKKLGDILFIPKAVNYTQDPRTLKDFWKQNMRWQRGFWQCIVKYRIGLRLQRIDISIVYQIFQIIQLLIIWPAILLVTHHWYSIPIAFSIDIILNSLIALGSSVVIKRWSLIGMLPYFYLLRWIEMASTIVAFFEVIVLRKFKEEVRGWATEGRRYKLTTAVLRDTA